MVIDFELLLLLPLAVLTGAFGLRFMWTRHRFPTPRRVMPTALDPVTGTGDRPSVYDSGGAFIPMPNHLKTNHEMVAWMTDELPRLTAERSNPRP
ncbi:hypothetical protein ACFOYU_14115 [Microvirga sp. GCM10011540]|uniref:hypothetical protein n=1 Tax=Microvirga sp. GCM10011540 TaxID=3317338 RepID=UPI00361CBBF9